MTFLFFRWKLTVYIYIDYGCVRVDDATHWTSIMGTIKTEYDQSDTVSDNTNVVTADKDDIVDTTCYMDESLAINLGNTISNVGVCGNGADSQRCDDGQCCSSAGYCGPENDGDGWVNYDKGGYYATEDEAFATYCTNPLGDWRVFSCTPDSKSASPIFLDVFFPKFLLFVAFLFCTA